MLSVGVKLLGGEDCGVSGGSYTGLSNRITKQWTNNGQGTMVIEQWLSVLLGVLEIQRHRH